jgi:hypothetical protein
MTQLRITAEANPPTITPPLEQRNTGLLSKVDTDNSPPSAGRRDHPFGILAPPVALGEGSESLGNFLDRQSTHGIRVEMSRRIHDDSSVAILAENMEKQAIASAGSGDTWNDGVGISDFMGWAHLAIRASDTESVRGFVQSQNLDYNQDFDDESTIASAYYDDDASIVSGIATPRQFDVSYFDDYQALDEPEYREERNYASLTPAKVAASILFSDSETESSSVDKHQITKNGDIRRQHEWDDEMMDMALSYDDAGLDPGLSFGTDVGFDDGLGFGSQGGGDDIVLGSFATASSIRPNYGTTNSQQSMNSPKSRGEKQDKNKMPPTSKWLGGWGKGA